MNYLKAKIQYLPCDDHKWSAEKNWCTSAEQLSRGRLVKVLKYKLKMNKIESNVDIKVKFEMLQWLNLTLSALI